VDLNTEARVRGERVVVSPSGQRVTQQASTAGVLELSEQGVYEIRGAGASSSGRPQAIAVNLDPAESDLTPIDTRELVAAVTGRATPSETEPQLAAQLTREDNEKRQALWWYLLVLGLLLLAAETTVANRLSRKEKFL
jgi:hypothetical protein